MAESPARAEATEDVIAAPSPPRIILKADDMRPGRSSTVSSGWQMFADDIVANDLKASVGLIGRALATANEPFIAFLKHLHASGHFELWNHGYDHLLDGELKQQVNGEDVCVRYDEFRNTCFDYQSRHLLATQEMARARLAITLTTFGAPGNQIDDVTTRAVDEAPDITVWLFGNRNSHKRVIPRLVDIEAPLGTPNFDVFVREYQQNRAHDVLALQCHPYDWTDVDMKELDRVIAFLRAQHASFVLPREL